MGDHVEPQYRMPFVYWAADLAVTPHALDPLKIYRK
jgi:hypothetical protein